MGRCRDPRSAGPGRSRPPAGAGAVLLSPSTPAGCLDEIQLLPEFLSLLRAEIDRDRRPGRFLLLGSASGPLLRQSHESLAGRIAQLELTPFLLKEVAQAASWQQLWLRGGFPESLLAAAD